MDTLGSRRGILIVLGMHRSGTSLCSHVLSALGCDMADDITANPTNAKGHWERWELVGFHDRILALFDRGWFGPNHGHGLPPIWWADPRVRAIRNEMVAWLRERMANSRRFGFKDPRTALLLPLWDEICAELELEPRFVFCVRHPAPVARSLHARASAKGGTEGQESAFRWVVYNASIVLGLGRRPACIVPYDWWFEPGSRNLHALARLVGAEPLLENDTMLRALEAIADPGLRHQLPPPLGSGSSVADRLFDHLMHAAAAGEIDPGAAEIARLFREFGDLTQHIQQRAETTTELGAKLAEAEARAAELGTRENELRAALAAGQDAAAAELDRSNQALDALRGEAERFRLAALEAGSRHDAARRALQDELDRFRTEAGQTRAALQAQAQAAQAEAEARRLRVAELERTEGELRADLDHTRGRVERLRRRFPPKPSLWGRVRRMWA